MMLNRQIGVDLDQAAGVEAQGDQRSSMEEERKDWTVMMFEGDVEGSRADDAAGEEIEIELDEEDAVEASKMLGVTVYYSRKSFNPQVLFSDMINAWGLQRQAAVEKIGDYLSKVEFIGEEEKLKVLEGGPWRHKGDALIVTHYDGLIRPLEICINSIAMWARLYDLPVAMMKPTVAQQLGGHVGEFLKSDSRIPGYLRVHMKYPLGKPLMPHMKVKVKGRGPMMIKLRYENVPHFFCAIELGMLHLIVKIQGLMMMGYHLEKN
jgi:hypothetical protein